MNANEYIDYMTNPCTESVSATGGSGGPNTYSNERIDNGVLTIKNANVSIHALQRTTTAMISNEAYTPSSNSTPTMIYTAEVTKTTLNNPTIVDKAKREVRLNSVGIDVLKRINENNDALIKLSAAIDNLNIGQFLQRVIDSMTPQKTWYGKTTQPTCTMKQVEGYEERLDMMIPHIERWISTTKSRKEDVGRLIKDLTHEVVSTMVLTDLVSTHDFRGDIDALIRRQTLLDMGLATGQMTYQYADVVISRLQGYLTDVTTLRMALIPNWKSIHAMRSN